MTDKEIEKEVNEIAGAIFGNRRPKIKSATCIEIGKNPVSVLRLRLIELRVFMLKYAEQLLEEVLIGRYDSGVEILKKTAYLKEVNTQICEVEFLLTEFGEDESDRGVMQNLLATYIKSLSDDQRLELFVDYCKHCGIYDGDSPSSCQCWNDE